MFTEPKIKEQNYHLHSMDSSEVILFNDLTFAYQFALFHNAGHQNPCSAAKLLIEA